MGQALWRDLGPCVIEIDGAEVGTLVGDVSFKHTQDKKTITDHAHGTSPVDAVYLGSEVEIKTVHSPDSLTDLVSLIPGAEQVDADGKKSIVIVKDPVGRSDLDNAVSLVIKPIVDGEAGTDDAEWLTFSKAAPSVDSEMVWGEGEDRRAISLVWTCYPDPTTGARWQMGVDSASA